MVPGRHGGLDQDQGRRLGCSRRSSPIDASSASMSRGPGAHVAQRFLEVVALHVHHHHVGQLRAPRRCRWPSGSSSPSRSGAISCVDLRVLGLDRRDAAVEQRDLPEAARCWAAACRSRTWSAALRLSVGIGHHGRHDRADETDADHDHDLAPRSPLSRRRRLQAREFAAVVRGIRQRKRSP